MPQFRPENDYIAGTTNWERIKLTLTNEVPDSAFCMGFRESQEVTLEDLYEVFRNRMASEKDDLSNYD